MDAVAGDVRVTEEKIVVQVVTIGDELQEKLRRRRIRQRGSSP
jgi:hypothetical protein